MCARVCVCICDCCASRPVPECVYGVCVCVCHLCMKRTGSVEPESQKSTSDRKRLDSGEFFFIYVVFVFACVCVLSVS